MIFAKIAKGQKSACEHAVPVHVREEGHGSGGPTRRAARAEAGGPIHAGRGGEGQIRTRNCEGKEGERVQ